VAKIVWNGCNGFIEAEEARNRGYIFDGQKLNRGGKEYEAFEAKEINPKELPVDRGGNLVLFGVLLTETGRYYREVLPGAYQ